MKEQEAAFMRADAADYGWLADPEVFAVNRLPAHSDHRYYADFDSCGKGKQTLRQSLNGTWKLKWAPDPTQRPERFFEDGYDDSDFDTVEVPSHLELSGYGQIHYTNTAYPWDGHEFLRPPMVDFRNNPVACYVRLFDLEETLLDKRVCLSFQGAEEAIYVWLNGHFVGYGEDSFTPTEFDITELVRPAGNRLCVELYKRSSAAWIEDQDFFRFSGIFREVFLCAKPEAHVEDLKLTQDFDPVSGEGILAAAVRLSGAFAGVVSYSLTDAAGRELASGELDILSAKTAACLTKEEASCRILALPQQRIAGITPWKAGQPCLYLLTLCVRDVSGKVVEVVPCEAGFRRFEIRDGIMLLNGERLLVNGVNRHEWNPRRGRAVTEDDMLADIRILKANGINAVRTSHYPNQSLWYRLCDEAGICVMDEANLESHGSCMKMGITETSWNVPGNDERWLACCLDRARSMYGRDKNHPSILWWSAGNESHAGTVIQKMCEFFHREDPSRLVHYEGVFYDRSFDFITDIESRMYPHPEKVREYLESHPAKPLCLCEYMHDMGNSMGGLEDYMKLRKEFEQFQGGFLWDFIDQALERKDEKGAWTGRLGYGGDFGDRPTDYAFCANGLLFADRTEKPAMQEVRYWYLSDEMRAAFDRENEERRAELLENVRKKKQLRLGADDFLKVVHTDCNLGLYGEGFHYVFSFDKGGPVSLLVRGEEQVYRAPRPTFWRAPTENDEGSGFPERSAVWSGADLYSTDVECLVQEFGDGFTGTLNPLSFSDRTPAREDIREVEIRYLYIVPTVPETHVWVSWRVNARGCMRVSMNYTGKEGLPEPAVFGLQILAPGKLSDYSWDGLSGETYPDRFRGARAGTFTEPVCMTPYLVPQECRNHVQTVCLKAGRLEFLMDEEPFSFSVLPHTQQQIGAAWHQEELPVSARSVIRILGQMRGVGGIDSWGSDVTEPYRISGEKNLHFTFFIQPA